MPFVLKSFAKSLIRALVSAHRYVIAGFFLIFAFAGQTVSAATLQSINVAGWFGGGYSDDSTGAFAYCAISAPFNNGFALYFSVDDSNRWTMGLGDPAWRLIRGNHYPVNFSIDGGELYSTTARAFDTDGLIIELQANADVFNKLRHGAVLQVQAAAEHFSIDLGGTNQALTALTSCSNRWNVAANRSQSSDPFSAQPVSPDSGPSQQYAAEAITFATNMLSASGITGFAIQTPENAVKLLPGYDAVWTAPETLGAVRIDASASQSDVERVVTGISATDARACKGKFASTRLPLASEIKEAVLARVATACEEPAVSYYGYYTILARAKGGVYVSLVGGIRNPDGDVRAEKVDTDIHNALYIKH